MSEQLTMIDQPELSHEDKLWFRAALKECELMQEHMVITEVVEAQVKCFNCQS